MTQPVFGIAIERVSADVRPPAFGDMSVCGLIGTAPGALSDTKATIAVGAANAAFTLTAELTGTLGNAVTLTIVNPGSASAALSVVVEGAGITVNLATSAGSAITSTATQVVAAINASVAASALVTAALASGSTGASTVAAQAIQNLAGGVDEPFPVNTPVLIVSDDPTAVAALGSTGTLPAAVRLLDAQLGEFQSSAKIVIVRVAEGANDDLTIANIVGNGTTTGISAFLDAAPTLGVTPRLIAAPGYTHQRSGSNANAVTAALPPVCAALLAHAVVDGPGATLQGSIDWRETLASDRLIAVDPAVKASVGGVVVTQPLSPAVLGIAVRRDNEKGGRPFHSWANQPVFGIVGPSRAIRFSMTDGATEGQSMLAANIGILLRAELGADGSLADGGFVFVGTDNVGADDLWRFYNVTRGRDYIHLMLLKTLRTYLGRFNITRQTVQAVLNTMDAGLRSLQAEGDILGYQVKFVAAENSPEDIRAGKIVVNFDAEEAPVLRRLGVKSGRSRWAVDALISDLAS